MQMTVGASTRRKLRCVFLAFAEDHDLSLYKNIHAFPHIQQKKVQFSEAQALRIVRVNKRQHSPHTAFPNYFTRFICTIFGAYSNMAAQLSAAPATISFCYRLNPARPRPHFFGPIHRLMYRGTNRLTGLPCSIANSLPALCYYSDH